MKNKNNLLDDKIKWIKYFNNPKSFNLENIITENELKNIFKIYPIKPSISVQTKKFFNSKEFYYGEVQSENQEIKHGRGILVHLEFKYFYMGEFNENKLNGLGKIIFKSGNIYEGEFKNNLKEGKGIFYYNNGDRYEGDWKNDLKEGKGIYYINDGNRYEGDWKNNLREGKGIFYYNDGSREMGDYLKDKPVGKHV